MKEEKEVTTEENNEDMASSEADIDVAESRIYEFGFLLDGDLPEDSIPAEVQKVKDVIEKGEFRYISEGFPEKMDLEYTMTVSHDGGKNSYDTAYFGWVKYEKVASSIEEVSAGLKSNSNIVRFITIKADAEDLIPFKNLPKKEAPKLEKKTDKAEDLKEPISISKEELDKTIEELVIN